LRYCDRIDGRWKDPRVPQLILLVATKKKVRYAYISSPQLPHH
jgi:hypothetical protein